MSDANTQLMTRIRSQWGAAIEQACAASSVPASFVAALIANESGGDPHAKRFEPAVFGSLWEVLVGRKKAYGSLQQSALAAFVDSPATSAELLELAGKPASVSAAMLRLDGLATSQGLTQVMGYEAIAFHLDSVELLADPVTELPVTLRMLSQCAEHFGLDLGKDFDQLLSCWNTGRPHGKTFDPNYVANGIARMQAYAALPGGAA